MDITRLELCSMVHELRTELVRAMGEIERLRNLCERDEGTTPPPGAEVEPSLDA